jgi:hypothetical protein
MARETERFERPPTYQEAAARFCCRQLDADAHGSLKNSGWADMASHRLAALSKLLHFRSNLL